MPLQSTSGAATYDAFGAPAASAVTQADAIDYDGTNDYLGRASNMVGSTNGKTFTFSFWLYTPSNGTGDQYIFSNYASGPFGFYIVRTGTAIQVWATNAGGSTRLDINAIAVRSAATFENFLISVDMASTSNCFIYQNDIQLSVTQTTYTNDNLSFTYNVPYVGVAGNGTSSKVRGRLSNVYFDQTYRDLSITANRRLFVTADLKPALGQAALNPILYLSMADPTQPGKNSGTGGDFDLTGVVARSGRGPNQYNAPYSTFDGATDYLSRTTALTGVTASKEFTLSFCFSRNSGIEGTPIELTTTGGFWRFAVYYYGSTMYLYALNASNTNIIEASIQMNLVTGRNYTVTMSCDLTSTSKRHVYINGQTVTVSWSAYVNDSILFNTASPTWRFGVTVFNNRWLNGRMGAFYLGTSYIDLSQPANLAKFVTGAGINAAPVNLGATGELPTGTSPLIYLPMDGGNAGKNYGTGGNFTVNSGPYAGARGPNEFWGNIANNAATNSSLYSTDFAINSDTATMSFWFKSTSPDTTNRIVQLESSSASSLYIECTGTDNQYRIRHFNPFTGQSRTSAAFNAAAGAYVQFSKSGSTYTLYVNGSPVTFSGAYSANIQAGGSTSYVMNCFSGRFQMSEFYLSSGYVDFSQEANRLKFRDCFGNPTDLPSAITAVSIPTPAIYLRFPPTSFGTNSGTGGDFTVNSTITDGGQL